MARCVIRPCSTGCSDKSQLPTQPSASLNAPLPPQLPPIGCAVLDAGGHLVAFQRVDGLGYVPINVCHAKAWGALGTAVGNANETAECIELFSKGMEKYLARDWEHALSLFLKAAKLEPNQPGGELGIVTNPSMVMIERVPEMKVTAPGDDCDGVYVMTSK